MDGFRSMQCGHGFRATENANHAHVIVGASLVKSGRLLPYLRHELDCDGKFELEPIGLSMSVQLGCAA